MMKPASTILLLAAALLTTACDTIPAKPGAARVAVIDEAAAASCERKGATTVSVLARMGFVERTDEVIAEDLVRLAANDAADLGGDSLLPLGPVAEGKRKFAIYRCKKAEAR